VTGDTMSRREAAVLLMGIIRNEGGTFELINDDQNFNCNLDGVRDFKDKDPHTIASAVLTFRAEILQVLRSERIQH
jgi:hypothetical protein